MNMVYKLKKRPPMAMGLNRFRRLLKWWMILLPTPKHDFGWILIFLKEMSFQTL